MAYIDPPTFVAGNPVAAAELNVLGDDIEYLQAISQGLTFSGVQLNRSANQSIPSSTHTYLSFDSEQFDFGGWWASGATVTVPPGAIPAGFTTIAMQLTASVKFASNGTGYRRVELHKNGASIGGWQVSALTGDVTDLILPEFTTVAAGDTLKLDVYQNCGSALNVVEARLTAVRFAPAA